MEEDSVRGWGGGGLTSHQLFFQRAVRTSLEKQLAQLLLEWGPYQYF